jgi:membrane-bound serine protease (ClpP class)
MPFIQVSWKVIAFATIITTLFFVFALGFGIRAQRRKPVTGQEGLVGERGEAVADFAKGKGQVKVHGEIWEAFSEQKIKKNDEIIVESIDNLKIIVKKKA